MCTPVKILHSAPSGNNVN